MFVNVRYWRLLFRSRWMCELSNLEREVTEEEGGVRRFIHSALQTEVSRCRHNLGRRESSIELKV